MGSIPIASAEASVAELHHEFGTRLWVGNAPRRARRRSYAVHAVHRPQIADIPQQPGGGTRIRDVCRRDKVRGTTPFSRRARHGG